MTTKHTPGPWSVQTRLDTTAWRVSEAERIMMPGAVCAWVFSMGAPHAQVEADARLIAAAPDLLAAAKQALATAEDWIHDQLDGTSMLENALAELQPVRRAIAKAKGTQT